MIKVYFGTLKFNGKFSLLIESWSAFGVGISSPNSFIKLKSLAKRGQSIIAPRPRGLHWNRVNNVVGVGFVMFAYRLIYDVALSCR